MAEVTGYAALPFVADDPGAAAGEPTEFFNPVAAGCALRRFRGNETNIGAVAFSRTGDPATGVFSNAKVIKRFGAVPDDLSAL
jgi:hypothetical protein